MPYVAPDTTSLNYLLDTQVVPTTTLWTVSFWMLNTATLHQILYTTASPSISIIMSAAHTLQVGSDASHYVQKALNHTTGWTNIWVTNAAGTVVIYQGTVSLGSTAAAVSATAIFTPNVVYLRGGATVGFIRIWDQILSAAALSYHNADVLVGADKTEPI